MIRIILVALAAVLMASEAFADGILQYTGAGSAARALFPANDLLDWGQLGPPCQTGALLCIPNGAVATSNRGIAITITTTTGAGFTLDDEGTAGWSGGFQIGDHVLTDASNPGSGTITFTLNKLVAGIGFELYTNNGTFPETVQILDDKGNLLASMTQPVIGGACLPPCNDAPFFGFFDLQGRIASVVINPTPGVKIGWNQVSLIDEPALTFAGTPGQANCWGQSNATLSGLYGSLDGAAAALGFTSTAALRNDVKDFCGG